MVAAVAPAHIALVYDARGLVNGGGVAHRYADSRLAAHAGAELEHLAVVEIEVICRAVGGQGVAEDGDGAVELKLPAAVAVV